MRISQYYEIMIFEFILCCSHFLLFDISEQFCDIIRQLLFTLIIVVLILYSVCSSIMCDGDKVDVSLYVYWLCSVVWFVRMTVFFIAVCMRFVWNQNGDRSL